MFYYFFSINYTFGLSGSVIPFLTICCFHHPQTTGNGPIKCPICGKYFEDIVTAELVRGTSSEPDEIDDDSHVHVEAQVRYIL